MAWLNQFIMEKRHKIMDVPLSLTPKGGAAKIGSKMRIHGLRPTCNVSSCEAQGVVDTEFEKRLWAEVPRGVFVLWRVF